MGRMSEALPPKNVCQFPAETTLYHFYCARGFQWVCNPQSAETSLSYCKRYILFRDISTAQDETDPVHFDILFDMHLSPLDLPPGLQDIEHVRPTLLSVAPVSSCQEWLQIIPVLIQHGVKEVL